MEGNVVMTLDNVTDSYNRSKTSELISSNQQHPIYQMNGNHGFDSGTSDIENISHRSPGDLNYRTMMWAALATLVALLLVFCVIFLLVWRYFRRKLKMYRNENVEIDGDDIVLPEEMPLQPEDSFDIDLHQCSESEKSPNHISNAQESQDCTADQELMTDFCDDTKRLVTDHL